MILVRRNIPFGWETQSADFPSLLNHLMRVQNLIPVLFFSFSFSERRCLKRKHEGGRRLSTHAKGSQDLTEASALLSVVAVLAAC